MKNKFKSFDENSKDISIKLPGEEGRLKIDSYDTVNPLSSIKNILKGKSKKMKTIKIPEFQRNIETKKVSTTRNSSINAAKQNFLGKVTRRESFNSKNNV